MTAQHTYWSREEAAAYTLLEITVVQHYADMGVVAPEREGYSDEQLAELRAIRRLMTELELDPPAIEVIMRMRRRMLALQQEMNQLKAELRRTRRTTTSSVWLDADWDDE